MNEVSRTDTAVSTSMRLTGRKMEDAEMEVVLVLVVVVADVMSVAAVGNELEARS